MIWWCCGGCDRLTSVRPLMRGWKSTILAAATRSVRSVDTALVCTLPTAPSRSTVLTVTLCGASCSVLAGSCQRPATRSVTFCRTQSAVARVLKSHDSTMTDGFWRLRVRQHRSLHSFAAIDKISTVTERRAVPLRQQSLLPTPVVVNKSDYNAMTKFSTKLEQRCFTKQTARRPPRWQCIGLRCVQQTGVMGCTALFCPWWPWYLTFDLDIQTRPSEGPNTSSLWIWHKSVQRFQRYLIHKQKMNEEKSHRQR